MTIRRTIPPAAAPLGPIDILNGLAGLLSPKSGAKRLESELKDAFGARHVFLVSSGKAALTLILLAMKKLSPGRDRVVIPAYTCYSVPASVIRAGLDPVPCDLKPGSFDMDPDLLEKAIDGRTLCVVPGHLFGFPSDIEMVKGLCSKKGAFVIEDAAQAMGLYAGGRAAGTLGDAGFFSLGRGKMITCGSGGIILTGSDALAGEIKKGYRALPDAGFAEGLKGIIKLAAMLVLMRPSLYWIPSSMPSLQLGQTLFETGFPVRKLSGAAAGVLKTWRARLNESMEARRENGAFYSKALGNKPHGALALLRMPVIARDARTKAAILKEADRSGLGVSPMYPGAINEIGEIRDRFEGMSFPAAKDLASRLLTLPTHHLLTARDRETIAGLFQRERGLEATAREACRRT